MPKEIERRFLVKKLPFLDQMRPINITQGYMMNEPDVVVRVRTTDTSGFVTIKGPKQNGSGDEEEFPVSLKYASTMISHCPHIIKKQRYEIDRWELDVFSEKLQGLLIVEIELNSIDEPITIPDWVGDEITEDKRYSNNKLATDGIPTSKKPGLIEKYVCKIKQLLTKIMSFVKPTN